MTFRNAFIAGLLLAAILGAWLFQLWRPQRQVTLHSNDLLRAIEEKGWSRIEAAIAAEYQDDWGHDRALVLARVRQVLSYTRNPRLDVSDTVVRGTGSEGLWRGRVRLRADPNEVTDIVASRVNALEQPFELRWRRGSWKPWDWKLVRVSNPALEIPDN
jgi:hypothetical protein